MRISAHRIRKPRAGINVVEFAVVVPIFFLFVFGIIEIARGFMTTHLLTNAARAGCRLGILSGKSTDDIKTAVNTVLGQTITGFTTTVTVNGKAVDASTAGSNDEISVVVSVPVADISWVPASHYLNGNIAGRYSLRRE